MCAQTNPGPNPSGLCMCGCGQPTRLARETNPKYAMVKGQPNRFLHGHNHQFRPGEQNVRWLADDAGAQAMHLWLTEHFPKTGVCEECGREVGAKGRNGTQYAFRFHGQKPYTRKRGDYRELCQRCHFAFDEERFPAFIQMQGHGPGRKRKETNL